MEKERKKKEGKKGTLIYTRTTWDDDVSEAR